MLAANIRGYYHPQSAESVISPCSFEIQPARIRCLVGPSGTGKTTLLRIVLGIADGFLDGEVTYSLSGQVVSVDHLRSRGEIGYLSDDTCLFPWLNVAENIALPSRINPNLTVSSTNAIDDILLELGLPGSSVKKLPHQLSFGMRRRVALARTLIYRPRYIFLDETFTGLDPHSRKVTAELIRNYVTDHSACCLLVTHELDTAVEFADDHTLITTNSSVINVDQPVTVKRLYDLLSPEEIQTTDHITF